MDASAMEDPAVLRAKQLLTVGVALSFAAGACSGPRVTDESLPPEVILTGARLRSFRGNESVASVSTEARRTRRS